MNIKFTSYYLDSPLVYGRVFDVFEPEEITKDVAVFLIHGGGWREGSRTEYHKLMEEFCNRGYIVASTDYRLDAPDAFTQLKDIREAYDRFVSILKEKNRPLKIATHGSSAGAHLCSLITLALPGECGDVCELKNEWVRPYKCALQATPVDFLPWEAMMPITWGMFTSIAGVSYDDNPDVYQRLSMRNYINDNNTPIFFQEAEFEHMFPSELTLEIAKKHRAMDIASHWKVYEKMEHGFIFALERKAQKEAFDDMCLFFEDKLETDI